MRSSATSLFQYLPGQAEQFKEELQMLGNAEYETFKVFACVYMRFCVQNEQQEVFIRSCDADVPSTAHIYTMGIKGTVS